MNCVLRVSACLTGFNRSRSGAVRVIATLALWFHGSLRSDKLIEASLLLAWRLVNREPLLKVYAGWVVITTDSLHTIWLARHCRFDSLKSFLVPWRRECRQAIFGLGFINKHDWVVSPFQKSLAWTTRVCHRCVRASSLDCLHHIHHRHFWSIRHKICLIFDLGFLL